MTLEEIEAKVAKQDADLAALKAENDVLKAANETLKAECAKKAVKKMPPEEGSAEEEAAETGLEEEEEMAEEQKKEKKEVKKAETAKAEADDTKVRLAKAETELADIRKRARLDSFVKKAEQELPHTPGSPVEKGEMLLTLANSLGGEESESFKKMFGTLKSADIALSANYRERGSAGSGGSVLGALDAKTEEIAKRDSVSREVAFAKAMKENPKLYEQYLQEAR